MGQGWFFTSAVTSPLTSLPRMMVRPLKAANPATTSAMLARSQVTVMRGSAARFTAIARVNGTPTSGRRVCAAGAAGTSEASSGSGPVTTVADDQAWKPASEPKVTRTVWPRRSTS
jgi:hypothetical protein